MFTIAVGFLLVVGIILLAIKFDWLEFISFMLVIAVLTVAGALVIIIGAKSSQCTMDAHWNVPLYSGFSQQVTTGRFFLATGYINSQNVVYFWQVNEDGSFQQGSLPVSYATFFEEDRDNGYIEAKHFVCASSSPWGLYHDTRNEYAFHIPKGSIITGYNIK